MTNFSTKGFRITIHNFIMHYTLLQYNTKHVIIRNTYYNNKIFWNDFFPPLLIARHNVYRKKSPYNTNEIVNPKDKKKFTLVCFINRL